MGKLIDLSGQKFGKLLVINYTGKNKRRQSIWDCLCDCGNCITVMGFSLSNGNTKSCGCWRIERSRIGNATHGFSRVGAVYKIYQLWQHMLRRCRDPRVEGYKYYGGRGIKVCARWLKFENFYTDVGDIPEGMSFDRKNNGGDYEPGNWRWATPIEQANNKRNNVWYEYKDERKTVAQWARKLNMNVETLRKRLSKWTIERAFTTPVRIR